MTMRDKSQAEEGRSHTNAPEYVIPTRMELRERARDERGAPRWRGESVAAALISAVGIVALVLVASHALNNYLRPVFLPVVGLTALALLGLALWTFVVEPGLGRRGDKTVRPSSWLLVVPLLLAAFVAPAPLGSALLTSDDSGPMTASQRLNVTTAPAQSGAQTQSLADPNAPAQVMTMEELTGTWIFGPRDRLVGRRISVLGFAAPTGDGQWNLARYKIICCAADAIAYQARLEGKATPLTADQWYEVEGIVTGRDVNQAPVLEVTRVVEVPAPDEPYM